MNHKEVGLVVEWNQREKEVIQMISVLIVVGIVLGLLLCGIAFVTLVRMF